MYQDIIDFHKKYGLEAGAGGDREALLAFRTKFMKEELEEFITATTEADEFDALIDLVYVAMGTAYLLGFPWEEGWRVVQAANMKKVRAQSESESKRGSRLDVVKPPGWEQPDLTQFFD